MIQAATGRAGRQTEEVNEAGTASAAVPRPRLSAADVGCAQTERRGGAGPVRRLPGGGPSPAALFLRSLSPPGVSRAGREDPEEVVVAGGGVVVLQMRLRERVETCDAAGGEVEPPALAEP